MPDGVVQRIDDTSQTVYIVRRGRTYAASLNEVESKARVPSARVRFDLVRHQGSESAANVRLRTGTRTNRRQRRFGDLTGAKRPGAKVVTTAGRNFGVDVTTQPFRVAGAWIDAMGDCDFDGAIALYGPRAVLHTASGSVTGRRRIRSELERCQLGTVDAKADVRGSDRYVRLDVGPGDATRTVFFEIERGSIVEQWIDVVPPQVEPDREPESIEVLGRGDVPDDALRHARERIGHLIDNAGPARFARIKLTRAKNPAVALPAMVESTIELGSGLVRAHANAETFNQATDAVAERLRSQIEQQHDRRRHRTSGLPPRPDGWRHGNRARIETAYYDRPAQDREIVRHKSFAPDEMTVEEAAWDMETLDYEFFLFVELTTGQDCVLERSEDGELLLWAPDQQHDAIPPAPDGVDVGTGPIPELPVSQAIAVLNDSGDRRLFFVNAATGRGNVIYRRYDGHYGLMTPGLDVPAAHESEAS